ncbi:MAG: queuosine precursor transporter [Candidatus Hodarchaeota archaeon]
MYEGLIVSLGVFILLGVVSYLGAWYTAKTNSSRALLGIYILFLTLAQFFAAKISIFNFGIIELIAPAGIIVFPFTLQITDMVNEKFGRKAVYEMIWIAFLSQVIMVILLIFASFPPALESDPLVSFAIVPTITIASWISFLISERFDAWIYDKFKQFIHYRSQGEKEWWKYLWIRNVFSDILSLGLDSVIFVPLAFLILPSIHGVLNPSALDLILPIGVILDVIVGQLITKWILGLIDTPYMYLTRWIYDKNTSTLQ